ncbi:MAG: hypothetical protein LC754_12915, partial [Acidobacteria bacterium]|nr:hypothetical protein [Acidobacteriota bacterium]
EQFSVTLAQVYMRRNDFKAARTLLEPIAQKGAEAYLRREAGELLNVVKQLEDYEAKRKEFESRSADGPPALLRRDGNVAPGAGDETDSLEVQMEQPSLAKLRPRAEGEEQIVGMLVQIECTARGALLHVRVGERLLKLNAGRFEHVDFVSYSKEMGAGGEIACGQRNPPNHVLVTYRPASNAPAPSTPAPSKRANDKSARPDGDVVAVDFIPKEWK